ncbi:forkhead-associated domain-containing protein 1, partial [Protopterus annectens]|uniref:forkhead-associated domain-containing protein 1 n=1 Tax=Protopterus annectens TaxID=7888 RepID=UPI001CFB141A
FQSNSVEDHHAVIEFNELENCFILQDLNSVHGTFVNDCRIQNAAVRLAAGDLLRFGTGGAFYEFVVDCSPQFSCPPMIQRSQWQGHLQLLEEKKPYMSPPSHAQFPMLRGHAALNGSNVWTQGTSGAVPHPPYKNRPVSAGSQRGANSHATEHNNGPPVVRQGGWINTPVSCRSVVTGVLPAASQSLELLLHEKEQRILKLSDEVTRLLVFESESKRKDTVIGNLRDENAGLKQQLVQAGLQNKDGEITQKLLLLERDIASKKEEIQILKDQITSLQKGSSEVMRHSLREKELEITNLKAEVEDLKRKNSMISGLVTSLQRDISTQEQKVFQLNSAGEKLKKEIREKNNQIAAMSAKELREVEQRVKELQGDIFKYQTDQQKLKNLLDEERKVQDKLTEEVERKSLELQEMRRREQLIKVDLEQSQARLERFRSRIIQTTYSAPDVLVPQTAVTELQVIEQMQQIIEQRTEYKNKLKELQEHLHWKSLQEDAFTGPVASVKKLREALQKCQTALKKDHCSHVLRKEITAFNDLPIDQSILWIQKTLVDILEMFFSWQQELEQCLQDDGNDTFISGEGIVSYIRSLRTKWQEAESQNKAIQAKLHEELESSKQLQKKQQQKEEMEEKIQEEIQRLQAKSEEQNRKMKETYDKQLQEEIERLQAKNEENIIKQQKDMLEKHLQEEVQIIQAEYEEQSKKFKEDTEKQLQEEIQRLQAESEKQNKKFKEDTEKQLQEEIQRLQAESEEQNKKFLEDAIAQQKEKMKKTIAAEKKKTEESEKRCQELKEILDMKYKEEEAYKSKLTDLMKKYEEAKTTIDALEQELTIQKNKLKSEISSLQDGQSTEKQKHDEEVVEYKEQIRQHSRTIVALEDRLQKVATQQQALGQENTVLQHKLRDAEEKLQKQETEQSTVQQVKPLASQEIFSLQETCVLLRKELVEAQREILSQQDVIAGMRRDLAVATAKMSDMRGELNEKQKLELEHNRRLVKEQHLEINTLRQQLAKMSELVDKKDEELKTANVKINSQQEKLEKQSKMITDKQEECEKLQEELQNERKINTKKVEIVKQTKQEMSACDVTEQGAKCIGHKHEEIIQRQREALAEHRARIKELEQMRLPVLSKEQFEKEFTGTRTQKAILDNNILRSSIQDSSQPETYQSKAAGAISATVIDRTTRTEMSEALDMSESMYMDLVNALSDLLNVNELSGTQSFMHVPWDERMKIRTHRQKDLELLSSRIKQLQSQLERKETLLSGYENDLEQLRLSQAAAKRYKMEMERLEEDLKKQSEESALLREALDRAQFRLDQEKRLNKAIKQRKTFHLEQLDKKSAKAPSHSCLQNDIHEKAEAKNKTLQEKLKKKEYDIDTLKQQLQKQDQELSLTTSKLINLQNTIGQNQKKYLEE